MILKESPTMKGDPSIQSVASAILKQPTLPWLQTIEIGLNIYIGVLV